MIGSLGGARRHRASVVALTVALTCGGLLVLTATSADAGDPVYQCNQQHTVCWPVVDPGHGPGSGGGGQGGGGGGGGSDEPPLCVDAPMDPQPPKTDRIWAGHTDGAIYIHACRALDGGPGTWGMFWAATAPPTITPAQLAQRALGQLTIPEPVLHRSPTEKNNDGGMPFTWVNLWTWFWTDPAVYAPISRTASAGAVWATVTAEPSALTFTPGTGEPPVPCPGPGRPWTTADGNGTPGAGGCAVRYTRASPGVTATMTIRWRIGWIGSGGGAPVTMAPMATSATSTFRVEQVQVVNR